MFPCGNTSNGDKTMNDTLPKQSGFTIRLDEETASDAIKQVENGPQPVIIGVEAHSPPMLFANAEQINAAFGAGSEAAIIAICALDTRKRETREEKEARLDRETFDKATKIDAKDYTGWVSCSLCWNGYFKSVDEVIVYCAENDLPRPKFVWACTSTPLKLDASDIIDAALEDHHEDARDNISDADEQRLQAFLDEWTAAQGIVSWSEDNTRAVMLPPGDGQ